MNIGQSETSGPTALFGLREASALCVAIVASSADAILSKTLDGTTTSWNPAAERLFGYTASEMIGQSVRRLIPAHLQAEEDSVSARIARGEQIGRYETTRLCKDGRMLDVSLSMSALRDQAGRIVGASNIMRDITAVKRPDALLAAIVTCSADPILSKTLDGIITSWNAAAETLFGYSAADMIGQSAHRIIPDDRQSEEDQVLERVAAGESITDYETVRLNRQGRAIDVSLTISPVRGRSGEIIGASKIMRDITEQKLASEKTHLLLSEVNHRAKNVIGLVQAIARQTFTAPQDEPLGRFIERLHALSANQDILMRNKWRGILLNDLVAIQLATFKDLFGTRIQKCGPAVELTPPAAQTFGLALHELTTNASKYGALSNFEGHIFINWRLEGSDFVIRWVERDGPPVQTPARTGFGSTLLSRIVRSSLEAIVDLCYDIEGFSWSVRCPAHRALVSAKPAEGTQ